MIGELDTIVLTHDINEHGLEREDVEAVVHRYPGGVIPAGNAFKVEFVTVEGSTVAVLTLAIPHIRPMGKGKILHALEFTAA